MLNKISLELGIGIVGILLTILGIVLSLVSANKRKVQNIKPRTKNGNIDMSQGEFTVEKKVYYNTHETKDRKQNKK